nr:mesoderm development candidate 2 [Tanacetum cinerariifolium]
MTVEEFDPPSENFFDVDFTQMQEEVMKRQVRQPYRFVKLRLTDDPRTP